MYSDGWQTTDSTRCSSLLNTGQCPEIVVEWLDRTVVEYHHLKYRITSLEIAKRKEQFEVMESSYERNKLSVG